MNKIITSTRNLRFLTLKEKKMIDRIFSPYVGIVNAVLERSMLKNKGLYVFQSLSARISEISDVHRNDVSSGGLGISSNPRHAFYSCIGESVERYSMSFFKRKQFIYSRFDDLPEKMKPSRENLNIYGIHKATKHKDARSEKIFWTTLISLKNRRKKMYWPASLVYLPFPYESIGETTSTGVAAGKKLKQALHAAILEVIERDAQMVAHFTRSKLCTIDLPSITGKLSQTITRLCRGFNIAIFQLPSIVSSIPVYGAYIWRNNKQGIHFGIGCAAHLDSDKAIEKALIECLFTYHYSKDLMTLRKLEAKKINALYEHFLFYQKNNFKLLLNTFSGTVPYKRTRTTSSHFIKSIKQAGYDVYYKDVTTPDIRESGFVVARVCIPGLIDLNKSHVLPKIGQLKRRFPQLKKFELTLPHPFP